MVVASPLVVVGVTVVVVVAVVVVRVMLLAVLQRQMRGWQSVARRKVEEGVLLGAGEAMVLAVLVGRQIM